MHDAYVMLVYDAGCGKPGCRMWDVRCRMQDVGCRMNVISYRMYDVL